MSDRTTESFHWKECAAVLRGLEDPDAIRLEPKGRFFVSGELRIYPPLVFPIAEGCTSLPEYLAQLPSVPGCHVVLLIQAGASSLGVFEGGEVAATKSFKRYVVRGKGRAQPTHLNAKGKSRYGSRLRLQNARRLLEETNEKLNEWSRVYGAPDHVFYSCPARLWTSVFEAKPALPFERDGSVSRIPLDVPRPTSEVVERTYRRMSFGRFERAPSDPC